MCVSIVRSVRKRYRQFIVPISTCFLLVASWSQLVYDREECSTNSQKSHKPKHQLPSNLKFILLWTPSDVEPFPYFGEGQDAFNRHKCAKRNCFVTAERDLFDGDITKFHAILFNGRRLRENVTRDMLPQRRAAHQKYVYVNQESPDYHPVCAEHYDDYFNWTFSYRLDSDIQLLYVVIRSDGQIVGPKQDMLWLNLTEECDVSHSELLNSLNMKRKAVAWFASHCPTRSHREDFVKELNDTLMAFNLSVDVYGDCGFKRCRQGNPQCDVIIRDYFYYLALENSFAKDYVTEKVLRALMYDAVPIVLGGADYNRFLPPGSYIDAQNQSVLELALTIKESINSLLRTSKYFCWKKHYSYRNEMIENNVCALCAALSDETKMKTFSAYQEFRKWWNPSYEERCITNYF